MRIVFAVSIFLALCLAPALPWAEAADNTAVTNSVAPDDAAPASEGAGSAIPGEDTAETAPAGEVKRKTSRPAQKEPEGLHVKVQNGLLSINVREQIFGEVISAIANAAGFDVKLSNDVFNMKLSTRFQGMKLQRGIMRLLSLIEQKNYFIHYKPDGSIKGLEVYGDLSSGKRSISGAKSSSAPSATTGSQTQPAAKPVQRRDVRSTAPPPAPPARIVPDRSRTRRISRPPVSETPVEEPEEPAKEEDVLELDYSIRQLPGGDDDESPDPGTGTSDEGPADSSTPAPAPAPVPGDVIEEEIIPEGDIPPADQLLNGNPKPPTTPPGSL